MSPSILFAEFHPWHSTIKVGGHHYAEQFVNDGWRVLWLANFLNLNRLVRGDDYDRLYYSAWKNGIQLVGQDLYMYTPFPLVPYLDLPFFSSLTVARNSLRWCFPSLPRSLAKANFDPVDVLWISQPRMYSLVRAIRYQRLVYRMFDDVQHFDGEPQTISKVEEWLCRQADVVFATSRSLVEKAKQWNQDVVYLPNGADVDKFLASRDAPPDLAKIPSPRILYVGAIAEWFDFDLIFETAKIKPDWSFVLVGPWDSKVRERRLQAKEITNIYYLGPKPPDQIPAYTQHADLGIIPFVMNDLTHSVSPIKLFEYSAAGLPVVAPRLGEIESYEAPILFYNDINQFKGALEVGLTNREKLSGEFTEFGKENSWEVRYKTIQKYLI